ncbi:hypothetical protein F2Q70_00017132 [Brassica cretica]|uniref:Uncharacterized protein n=1 Tax=Brassica cretica TaxID=69181 RepID=A0A8S9HYT9_BRACR|nr:hypothetical protein F2Q70_00017132 [Brassica cretica]
MTIRGRYEEEAIVRRTSSVVDRYRREASTIEDYDRSMYILYHRSMSRREMRDWVHAQQYQKQQGQTLAILRRSCSLGTNDLQRPTFHITRRISFHVDRFSHPTVDRHLTFIVDRSTSSTDLHRSTSIDTSIDHQSRNMVAIVILRHDEKGNLYDQDGHPHDDFWQVVKHEKLRERDFEVESSMSFGGSLWCRPMLMDAHRSTYHDEDRSTDYSNHRSTSSADSTAESSAVRIMTHEEFAEKHPHPPSHFYVKIDRRHEPAVDRQRETDIDRLPSPPIDRQAPLTYRV